MAAHNIILSSGKSNNRKTKRLFNSIRYGEDVSNVEAFLQEGADMDGTDSKGRTPLLLACLHRRKQIAHLLIKTGANVEGKCKGKNYTVLHCASYYGWTMIVRSLVKKLTDINAVDIRGDTALHHASSFGHLKIAKCLVQSGADINIKNHVGLTPLVYAAQLSQKGVFDLLLKSGTNVDGDERLLLYYALYNNWRETVKFLGKKLPELSKWYEISGMSLNPKSSKGLLKILKLLMGEPTDANTRNEMLGQQALFDAIYAKHVEVLKWLVERVPDLNKGNRHGETPLHVASNIDLDLVKILVKKGADMSIKDELGDTTLSTASEFGHLEVVKYLVKKGADINTRNRKGMTALEKSSIQGQHEVVKWLVENADILNEEKEKLLHQASTKGWKDIVQFLIKGGCNLDVRNEWGYTALSQACFHQHSEIAQALLQAGSEWDIVDTDGLSLLNYLIVDNMPEFIKLFIENGAYLKSVNYYKIVESSSLEVLQDAKLCCQAVLNKFNHHDLPRLYKLPLAGSLPLIEKMKIKSGSEVAQVLEHIIAFEILSIGHCNVLEIRPMALSVLSVRCVLEYYTRHRNRKNVVKQPAVFDSETNYEHWSKSRRLN